MVWLGLLFDCVQELDDELCGEVVDAEVAGIFERTQGNGFACAGHACDEDEVELVVDGVKEGWWGLKVRGHGCTS